MKDYLQVRLVIKIMLQKALEVCKEVGLNKVLIICLEDNIGSEKIILSCGANMKELFSIVRIIMRV